MKKNKFRVITYGRPVPNPLGRLDSRMIMNSDLIFLVKEALNATSLSTRANESNFKDFIVRFEK